MNVWSLIIKIFTILVERDAILSERIAKLEEDAGLEITGESVTQSQLQALQKSLESLREAMPGNPAAGNFKELPVVTDGELQSELGNLEYDHALTTPEEALADAVIFGFTPEEALADCHFQINMLQANYDELEDKYEATKRELAGLRSQFKAVQAIPQITSAPEIELPDPADLLNQFKAK
ncbi:hypothetical protein [Microcoleus sp. OTE_8_concoct_300]|uniref:hypothetical protein n=1 Tax=Microcoleus sp. OTE_8_concoct_300 TaxID=2964710 RepID=UPI00403F49A7